MPDRTLPTPPDPGDQPGQPPDLADVLVDVTALRARLDRVAGDLALVLPADRSAVTRRLCAVLGDGLELVDDVASGRIR